MLIRQYLFTLQMAPLRLVSKCGFKYAPGLHTREWTCRLSKSCKALLTTPERQDTLLVLIIRV